MSANTTLSSQTLNYAIQIQGGAADVDYSGSIAVNAATVSAVGVSDAHTGTMTFQPGSTITATDGDGLQFDNAGGTYNFNGTSTLNGGDAGIDILAGSNGTFTFGANTSITNPTGDAFHVAGNGTNSPAITYSGTLANDANDVIEISSTASGNTITFDGSVTDAIQDGGSGTGIYLNNVGQSVVVSADTDLTGDEGVDVDGGSGDFTFANTHIIDTGRGGCRRRQWRHDNARLPGIQLDLPGRESERLPGNERHAGGNSTFSGSVTATNGDGLQFDNADGSQYNFNGTVILNGGDAGVDIVNGSSAAFTFGNLTVTNPRPARHQHHGRHRSIHSPDRRRYDEHDRHQRRWSCSCERVGRLGRYDRRGRARPGEHRPRRVLHQRQQHE
ncbi:MAG: hypothetical protein R2849_07160 [Thermomicrobiales bacterium]